MKSTALAGASGRGRAAIRNLMEFLHLQSRLEAHKPTFSKFLGLSVSPPETDGDDKNATIREDRFSFRPSSSGGGQQHQQQQESLVFRYRFPPNDRFKYLEGCGEKNPKRNLRVAHRGPSLATYMSILDEVTTLSIISAAQKHPRPGVSVTMQAQWGPGAHYTHASSGEGPPLEEVDIVTTITKKGRTLGFVRAEVRDPSNKDGLICYFDHIKYLPTGWVLGMLLTPVGMWCLGLLLRYVAPYFRKKPKDAIDDEEENYADIMESFQQTSDTTATFRVGPQHKNGMGGLHGGVQAILMERLGTRVAQTELQKLSSNTGISDVECERLQVSYQSSASKTLELRAFVMDPPRPDRPSVTLRIEILRGRKSSGSSKTVDNPKPSKRVVVSEGILIFGNASSKTKDQ